MTIDLTETEKKILENLKTYGTLNKTQLQQKLSAAWGVVHIAVTTLKAKGLVYTEKTRYKSLVSLTSGGRKMADEPGFPGEEQSGKQS